MWHCNTIPGNMLSQNRHVPADIPPLLGQISALPGLINTSGNFIFHLDYCKKSGRSQGKISDESGKFICMNIILSFCIKKLFMPN